MVAAKPITILAFSSYIPGFPDGGRVSKMFGLEALSAAETFCRWKGVADWKTAAMNRRAW